jgi:hypothetical protein
VGLIWALCLGLLVVGLDQWLKICLKKQICYEIWDSLMLKSINNNRNTYEKINKKYKCREVMGLRNYDMLYLLCNPMYL